MPLAPKKVPTPASATPSAKPQLAQGASGGAGQGLDSGMFLKLLLGLIGPGMAQQQGMAASGSNPLLKLFTQMGSKQKGSEGTEDGQQKMLMEFFKTAQSLRGSGR